MDKEKLKKLATEESIVFCGDYHSFISEYMNKINEKSLIHDSGDVAIAHSLATRKFCCFAIKEIDKFIEEKRKEG